MDILVVGSGGREHAIIKKLAQSPSVGKLHCAPGNGGICLDAECHSVNASDFTGIVGLAKRLNVGLVVVAPDDPLCGGLVDMLEAEGITAFGPTKAAAVIEGSKAFSKELMKKYNIPTADYETFSDYRSALNYVAQKDTYPTVIKADGLALGKGVIIAKDYAEAEKALGEMFLNRRFGASGDKVVIEEFLTGVEASAMTFCDGKTIRPMASAKDHKRIFNHDEGPNTGGMGAIAPHPLYTPELSDILQKTIFEPTMNAMNAEGRTFKGVIFFGLMLTKSGPKVIEYNCRFGDPETQVVLPLLDGDLAEIMLAVANQRLSEVKFDILPSAAACVVLASDGYPGSYRTGFPISIPEDCPAILYHAGTKLDDGVLKTSGGRVLGVTAIAENLDNAIKSAYNSAKSIEFSGKYCRNDIGVIY